MPTQRLKTVADVDELVALLFDRNRDEPVVVVTTRHRETEPLIDIDKLAKAIEPLPVRLLETGNLTRHLTGSLPDLFGVFGGAARIWWPKLQATDDPHRHPLAFCYSPDEAPRAVQRLLSELERRSWQGSRYLVERPTQAAQLDHIEMTPTGTELSARVVSAQPGGGEVELPGGTRAWLVRRRRDPKLIANSTITVAITGYDGAQPLVRRTDRPQPLAEAPAAVTPASVLSVLAVVKPAGHEELLAELRAQLDEARRHAAQMEVRAEAAEAEVAEIARAAKREISDLRKERRSLQDQVKQLKVRLLGGADTEDPEDAFRQQVSTAWERTTTPADREEWPLQDFQIGPALLASLDLSPELRSKVAEVSADVVSGRFRSMPGREHHNLRAGVGGDAPQLVRADGAKAYRIAVQIRTPSARRLHYWRLPDGTVELSKVVLHDDMTIA